MLRFRLARRRARVRDRPPAAAAGACRHERLARDPVLRPRRGARAASSTRSRATACRRSWSTTAAAPRPRAILAAARRRAPLAGGAPPRREPRQGRRAHDRLPARRRARRQPRAPARRRRPARRPPTCRASSRRWRSIRTPSSSACRSSTRACRGAASTGARSRAPWSGSSRSPSTCAIPCAASAAFRSRRPRASSTAGRSASAWTSTRSSRCASYWEGLEIVSVADAGALPGGRALALRRRLGRPAPRVALPAARERDGAARALAARRKGAAVTGARGGAPAPIEEVVPHSGAMLLVGPVLEHRPEFTRCRRRRGAERALRRRADGRVPAWVALEWMAQCVAAHGGLVGARARPAGAPGPLPRHARRAAPRRRLRPGRRARGLRAPPARRARPRLLRVPPRAAGRGGALAEGNLSVYVVERIEDLLPPTGRCRERESPRASERRRAGRAAPRPRHRREPRHRPRDRPRARRRRLRRERPLPRRARTRPRETAGGRRRRRGAAREAACASTSPTARPRRRRSPRTSPRTGPTGASSATPACARTPPSRRSPARPGTACCARTSTASTTCSHPLVMPMVRAHRGGRIVDDLVARRPRGQPRPGELRGLEGRA